MNNDPFPYFTHLTQGQLGQMFGVSSHQIGWWLIDIGLRDANKRPSQKALQGGYVKNISSEDGPRFPAWEKERTVELLEKAGHRRLGADNGTMAEPHRRPLGPFSARRSGDDGDGYEIVAVDGTVSVWCRGERLAGRLAWLMNVADKHGKLN